MLLPRIVRFKLHHGILNALKQLDGLVAGRRDLALLGKKLLDLGRRPDMQLISGVVRFRPIALQVAIHSDELKRQFPNFLRTFGERTVGGGDHQSQNQRRQRADDRHRYRDRGLSLTAEVMAGKTARGKEAEQSAAENSNK